MSVPILIAVMLASVVALLPCRGTQRARAVMPVGIAAVLAAALYLCVPILGGDVVDEGMFYMDSLSAVFMLLVGVVGLMASVYSRAYMGLEKEEGKIGRYEEWNYYILLDVFICVMMLTFTARSMAVVWLGIGATTLVSTFLVGFYRNNESNEAAWKYIILCSVGITLALVGISIAYAASVDVMESGEALDWPALMAHAAQLDPTMMKMVMVLIVVGFGTKVGLAPMHTWLPDAHSQAPSPISGLLSAVLLNCAMYGILRFYTVSEIVNPGFASTLMLVFGLLSLGVAAFFILGAHDLKRMLAYSSIENMGLIAIGFGIGTPLAIAGAVIQMVAHSITKPILFFSAGNIIQSYGTRRMDGIRGVSKAMPFTSLAMAAGTLAIVGAPPFAVFIGELTLIVGAVQAGQIAVCALIVVLLSIVFAGFVRNVFPMLGGDPPGPVEDHREPSRLVPIAALIAMSLALGLFAPDAVQSWLSNIVGVFT